MISPSVSTPLVSCFLCWRVSISAIFVSELFSPSYENSERKETARKQGIAISSSGRFPMWDLADACLRSAYGPWEDRPGTNDVIEAAHSPY